MQAVWLEVANGSQTPVRLDPLSIDPAYYTPLEAAYVNHYSVGKRVFGIGAFWLLAGFFLLLLPLMVCKVLGARAANRRMDAYFKEHGFRFGPIPAGGTRSGFVFTSLDEGKKTVNVKFGAGDHVHEFDFSLEVPGLALGAADVDPIDSEPLEEVDEATLRSWLGSQLSCTTNKHGTAKGDPLNLVVAGNRSTVLQCFGARWDQAETVTLATCWKTAKAFLFEAEYRYSPVSPLYFAGRSQDLALQMARARINRAHPLAIVAHADGVPGRARVDRTDQPRHRGSLYAAHLEPDDAQDRPRRRRGARLRDELPDGGAARGAIWLRGGGGCSPDVGPPPQI